MRAPDSDGSGVALPQTGDAAQRPAPASTRELILETAARLFRQEGYAATSLRAVAQACELKAGSLYYHFASKDQIVGEVLDIGVRRVFDAVRAAVASLPAQADVATTLRYAIAAHLGALLHAHDFTSANIRIFGQVPDAVRAAHRALRKEYEQYWVELLRGLQQRGLVRPGVDLQRSVFFLLGAMNWTTEWHDERRATLDELAAELADLVTRGLQHPTSRPDCDNV